MVLSILFAVLALLSLFLEVFYLKYLALAKGLYLNLVLFGIQLLVSLFLRQPVFIRNNINKKHNRQPSAPTKGKNKTTHHKKETNSETEFPHWIKLLNSVNALLILACFDLGFRDYFLPASDLQIAKLGMVNSTHARMMARVIPQNIEQGNENAVTKATYLYKSEDDEEWNEGPVLTPKQKDDYVLQVTLNNLKPNTSYQVKWSILDKENHIRKFDELRFRTFPSETNSLKFVYSSCVRPGYPYMMKDIKGFSVMAEQNADFLLFLGDLIYSDYPFYYGDDLEIYRAHYRRLFKHSDSQKLFKMTPSFFIYDDHEIINDWDQLDLHPFNTALQAFNEYAGFGNPNSIDQSKNGGIYFSFDYGSKASFFLMDTRRYRSIEDKTMLGTIQLQEMKEWLLKTNSTFKFLVSSVPFTLNFPFNGKDTWREFKKERNEILQFISDHHISNVIVLSGDRHEVAITKLPGDVIEFSTSPVLQFYGPIATYEETEQDEKIFTWRFGNIKWASIEIENEVMKYKLFVNDISDTAVYELQYRNGKVENEIHYQKE